MRDADVAVTDDVIARAEAFRNEKDLGPRKGNVCAIIAAFACQFTYGGLFVIDIARGGFVSEGSYIPPFRSWFTKDSSTLLAQICNLEGCSQWVLRKFPGGSVRYI